MKECETYVVVFSSHLCGVLHYCLYSAIKDNQKKKRLRSDPAVVHILWPVQRGSVLAFRSTLASNE